MTEVNSRNAQSVRVFSRTDGSFFDAGNHQYVQKRPPIVARRRWVVYQNGYFIDGGGRRSTVEERDPGDMLSGNGARSAGWCLDHAPRRETERESPGIICRMYNFAGRKMREIHTVVVLRDCSASECCLKRGSSIILRLYDRANVEQTSSKCIQNTRANCSTSARCLLAFIQLA